MKRTAVRLNINRVRETIGCGGQDIHFIARVVSEKRPLNNTSRSTCPTPITWSSSNIGDKSIAPTTDYPIPPGRSGDTQSVKSPGDIDYPLSAGLGFLVDNEELREDRTTAKVARRPLRCFGRLRFLRIPFSRRKQSELETSFAAALFFQVARARLQQIIERHQTQKSSRGTCQHRHSRATLFSHAIYDHAEWLVWISLNRAGPHQITDRPTQGCISMPFNSLADIPARHQTDKLSFRVHDREQALLLAMI